MHLLLHRCELAENPIVKMCSLGTERKKPSARKKRTICLDLKEIELFCSSLLEIKKMTIKSIQIPRPA